MFGCERAWAGMRRDQHSQPDRACEVRWVDRTRATQVGMRQDQYPARAGYLPGCGLGCQTTHGTASSPDPKPWTEMSWAPCRLKRPARAGYLPRCGLGCQTTHGTASSPRSQTLDWKVPGTMQIEASTTQSSCNPSGHATRSVLTTQ